MVGHRLARFVLEKTPYPATIDRTLEKAADAPDNLARTSMVRQELGITPGHHRSFCMCDAPFASHHQRAHGGCRDASDLGADWVLDAPRSSQSRCPSEVRHGP